MRFGSAIKSSEQEGFTLPELIVVLAGVGILSSFVVMPAIIDYQDFSRVDEAKSLLNSTAADCLQGLRRKGEERLNNPVNENIISFARLKNTGYVFKDDTIRSTDEKFLPKCSTVLITAASDYDRDRTFPDLGFTLAIDGTLTKVAVNSGTKTKSPAESWAGINTTEGKKLVEWQQLNSAIINAKASCKQKQQAFASNPGTGRASMWEAKKTSKCTTKPPKFEDAETCTANGCTQDVYYLDGEICGYTSEAFEKCRSDKFDRECQEDRNNKKNENATTATIDGETLPRCGTERFWFFEGEDVGSEQAWSSLKCEQNKKELLSTTHSGPVEHCDISPIYIIGGEEIFPNGGREDAKAEFDRRLAENKDAQCTQALNNDAAGKTGGPFTSPTPPNMSAPIGEDCNIKYWYCEDKIYREETEYNEDERCKNKPKNCTTRIPICKKNNEKYFHIKACRKYHMCMGWI